MRWGERDYLVSLLVMNMDSFFYVYHRASSVGLLHRCSRPNWRANEQAVDILDPSVSLGLSEDQKPVLSVFSRTVLDLFFSKIQTSGGFGTNTFSSLENWLGNLWISYAKFVIRAWGRGNTSRVWVPASSVLSSAEDCYVLLVSNEGSAPQS